MSRLRTFIRSWPPTARLRLAVLHRLHAHRAMHFPPFAEDVHRESIPHTDYTRRAMVALALTRVRSEGIDGVLAEVGVYRGEMSRFIHTVMPERRLYLFDTFAGFPQNDLEPRHRNDERFRDTSVEMVLRQIGTTNNIIVRKGYVPETLKGLEQERFAFVLLDLDLHAPTLAALDFFYPRLPRGGYLFVHDFNSPESDWACKRALEQFLVDKPERLIELPDVAGTALFRKIS